MPYIGIVFAIAKHARICYIDCVKQCSKCSQFKALTEFYIRRDTVSGLTSACKVCCNARVLAWNKINAEKQRERAQRWEYDNREKRLASQSKYDKTHRGIRNANTRKRYASKLNSIPLWLSAEHLNTMRELYITARTRTLLENIPYEVDHVVPLQGENVCGLHVPWNLRVIPRIDNRRKGNKLS